jgi:hypothetical protein
MSGTQQAAGVSKAYQRRAVTEVWRQKFGSLLPLVWRQYQKVLHWALQDLQTFPRPEETRVPPEKEKPERYRSSSRFFLCGDILIFACASARSSAAIHRSLAEFER